MIKIIKRPDADDKFHQQNKKIYSSDTAPLGATGKAVASIVSKGDLVKQLLPEVLSLSSGAVEWNTRVKNYFDSITDDKYYEN